MKLSVLMSQSPLPLQTQTAMEKNFGTTKEEGPFASRMTGGSLTSSSDHLAVVSRYTVSGLMVSFHFKRKWEELIGVLQQVELLIADLGSDGQTNQYSLDDGKRLHLEAFQLDLLCNKYFSGI